MKLQQKQILFESIKIRIIHETILTEICTVIQLSLSQTHLFTWAIKQFQNLTDTGDVYWDCFMYFQPRISFQPRVVLNREQGIFGVWGDKK